MVAAARRLLFLYCSRHLWLWCSKLIRSYMHFWNSLIVGPLWHTFVSSLKVYERSTIEGVEDSYDGRYDSNGAEKSLESFVIQGMAVKTCIHKEFRSPIKIVSEFKFHVRIHVPPGKENLNAKFFCCHS